MDLYRVRKRSIDRRNFLWLQTGGDGDRACSRMAHRWENAQEWLALGNRYRRLCGNLFWRCSVPCDCTERRRSRCHRWAPFACTIRVGRRPHGARFGCAGCHHRRRHANTVTREISPVTTSALFRNKPGHVGSRDGAAGCAQRPGWHTRANGLVLYQSGVAHIWRCLCGIALRVSGCGREFSLAHCTADDRWIGAWRDDAGAVDHGGCVCRLCRGLDQIHPGAGHAFSGCGTRRQRGDFFHLPALLPVYSRRRAIG